MVVRRNAFSALFCEKPQVCNCSVDSYLTNISFLCLFIGDVIRHIPNCGRESKSSEWIVQFSPIVEFAGHKVLIRREKSTVIGRDELKLPAGGKVFENIAFISPVVDRENRGHSRAGDGRKRPA